MTDLWMIQTHNTLNEQNCTQFQENMYLHTLYRHIWGSTIGLWQNAPYHSITSFHNYNSNTSLFRICTCTYSMELHFLFINKKSFVKFHFSNPSYHNLPNQRTALEHEHHTFPDNMKSPFVYRLLLYTTMHICPAIEIETLIGTQIWQVTEHEHRHTTSTFIRVVTIVAVWTPITS